jgi:hypothetical protein
LQNGLAVKSGLLLLLTCFSQKTRLVERWVIRDVTTRGRRAIKSSRFTEEQIIGILKQGEQPLLSLGAVGSGALGKRCCSPAITQARERGPFCSSLLAVLGMTRGQR